MIPNNVGSVHGCLQIINAISYKIPPHKPINILASTTPIIFAVRIWILLLLDVKTNVTVFKSNSSPKLFSAKNIMKILEKFPFNLIINIFGSQSHFFLNGYKFIVNVKICITERVSYISTWYKRNHIFNIIIHFQNIMYYSRNGKSFHPLLTDFFILMFSQGDNLDETYIFIFL